MRKCFPFIGDSNARTVALAVLVFDEGENGRVNDLNRGGRHRHLIGGCDAMNRLLWAG